LGVIEEFEKEEGKEKDKEYSEFEEGLLLSRTEGERDEMFLSSIGKDLYDRVDAMLFTSKCFEKKFVSSLLLVCLLINVELSVCFLEESEDFSSVVNSSNFVLYLFKSILNLISYFEIVSTIYEEIFILWL
jgi:hypothetical protein